MKKTLAALLASAALLAVPAVANAHEGDRDDWGRNSGYTNLRQEFDHLYSGVQHGLRDGSFSRGEARQFYWAINSLRRRLDAYWYNDGYLSRRERWDIQRGIQRLHRDMHQAHADGHAEQDYGYRDNGYYRGDDGGYDRYRRGDDRDNRYGDPYRR